ncbi:MAG: phosphoribosylaminoimidazolesuccinocarboxamide synthase [Methylococcus sp.]|nr:MAG: phosphoribosylaminoimidazolesuccinocarboxamide synthase [Methylococcus sp.]
MTAPKSLYQTDLHSLKLLARGKVRDIYEIDQDLLLIVTSDRLSAFDCVLEDPIPGKGLILTAVSAFWFERLAHVIPNQMTDIPLQAVIKDKDECALLQGRAIVVKKLKALPIEAVVRGYLIGSGWKEYQQHQSICGLPLPEGLRQAEKLQEPLFTPSTKADLGGHDENIPFEKMETILGARLASEVREVSLRLYREASAYALERGIIIADTKFEFGLNDEGTLHLIDEALTPDSSRFWPVDQYQVGISPPSFDKQFVRDYLESLDWNKAPPAPHLPEEILQKTSAKYREALERLTKQKS